METAFLFLRCQVHQKGDELIVAVPADALWRAGKSSAAGLRWEEPARVPSQVAIECVAGAPARFDHAEYARQKPYPHAAEFRFRGAATYGRVPTREGWALCVQGAVRSIDGLPHADAFLVIVPEPGGARLGEGGPVNGPHLPWP